MVSIRNFLSRKFSNYIYLIEHFIVWMRTAGLPNFRKLYGRISDKLAQGDYYLHVQNNYDVSHQMPVQIVGTMANHDFPISFWPSDKSETIFRCKPKTV